jgi:hypothetical protein
MRRYAQLVQALIDSVLRSPGAMDPALRAAAESRAAQIATADTDSAGSLPPELAPFVEKVARHAYEVTEDDLAALRRAGYSEDAIFEITISTALGAGQARLRRALSVLQEGEKP